MVMVFCCSVPVLAAQNDDIRVVMVDYYNAKNEHVSKKEIKFDVKPVIVDGRTMVPIRFIAEELGYEVTYQPDYQLTVRDKVPTVILEKKYSTSKNLRSSYPMYDLLVSNLCKWAEKSSSTSRYIQMTKMSGVFSKYAFCLYGQDNIPANILGDYLNMAKTALIVVEIPISPKYRDMPVTFNISTDDVEKSFLRGSLFAPTDVPAQIINDRTLIPLRALSESLGLRVEWDGNSRTVFIYGR